MIVWDLKVLYKYLKEQATKIHFFGLGFIQVKVNDNERYHFYSQDLAAIVPREEIHDHRYDFTSSVVKGVLSQEIYTFSVRDKSDHVLRYVSCDPNYKAPADRQYVIPELLSTIHSNRGSQYKLGDKAMHRVLPVAGNTITYLERGPKAKPFARVISSANDEVCPFSKELQEDELWERVKKIIED